MNNPLLPLLSSSSSSSCGPIKPPILQQRPKAKAQGSMHDHNHNPRNSLESNHPFFAIRLMLIGPLLWFPLASILSGVNTCKSDAGSVDIMWILHESMEIDIKYSDSKRFS